MKHYDALDLLGNPLRGVPTPTAGTDAANKAYVDGAAGGGGLSPTLFNANTILKADTDDTPVALTIGPSTLAGRGAAGGIAALTPAQAKAILAIVPVDVAGFDAQVRTNRLDQMATPTTPVSLGGQGITNLGAPANPTDAATKAYVDTAAGGGSVTGTANRITVTGSQVDIAPTYVGQASITTVGAITTGEWRVETLTACTRLGFEAGNAFVACANNTLVGYQTGKKITTGNAHTMLGTGAGANVVGSHNNTFLGHQAGAASNQADNVYVGYQAGSAVIGAQNTLLGSGAGAGTSASSSVAIGYQTALGGGPAYAICIGTQATVGNGAVAATAIGYLSSATADFAIAIGVLAAASASGAIAIGRDSSGVACTTSVLDEIKFGTVNHRYNFPGQLNQPLNAGAKKITNLATPTVGTDAATMAYVDSKGSGITPNSGWSVTPGYTVDKAFNPESTTVTEVARALGTLIDALKAQNILAV